MNHNSDFHIRYAEEHGDKLTRKQAKAARQRAEQPPRPGLTSYRRNRSFQLVADDVGRLSWRPCTEVVHVDGRFRWEDPS